jgi:hypothetical protein
LGLITSAVANATSSNISSVPEPENISLMLVGLGLIGLIVYRKR